MFEQDMNILVQAVASISVHKAFIRTDNCIQHEQMHKSNKNSIFVLVDKQNGAQSLPARWN